jgi:diaminobutyrate-2-oxoglutarate transaminase
VAGKAGMEYMLEHNLEAEVRRKGEMVDKYLTENLPKVCPKLTHRGRGLIWGIDFAAFPDGTAKAASAECFKRGLVIELAGRRDCVLKPMPPLTIADADLLRGLDIILESIRALHLQ